MRSYTEALKSRWPPKPCNLDAENETCSGIPVFDAGTGLPNVFEEASGQCYDAPGYGRDGSHLVPFTQAQLAQLRRVRHSLAPPAPQALPPSTGENADTAHPDGPAQNAQGGEPPQFLGTLPAASTNPEATAPIASPAPSDSPVPATTPAAGPASSVAPPCPADSKQRPTPPADPTTADPVDLLSQSTPADMWQRVAATCGQPQPRNNNSRAYWQWVDCRWRVYGRK